jgi:hypothetical protein
VIIMFLLALQLQHHDLQPESCQDRISRQRHIFLDAAKVTRDKEQFDALMGWYVDTSNGRKVAYACSNPKHEAEVMLRVDIARYFILTEPKK